MPRNLYKIVLVIILAIVVYSFSRDIRFSFIGLGMTKAQVEKCAGQPVVIMNDNKSAIWAYANTFRPGTKYRSARITGYTELVYFDPAGKVVKIDRNKRIDKWGNALSGNY